LSHVPIGMPVIAETMADAAVLDVLVHDRVTRLDLNWISPAV